jgi:hypothetical protein
MDFLGAAAVQGQSRRAGAPELKELVGPHDDGQIDIFLAQFWAI